MSPVPDRRHLENQRVILVIVKVCYSRWFWIPRIVGVKLAGNTTRKAEPRIYSQPDSVRVLRIESHLLPNPRIWVSVDLLAAKYGGHFWVPNRSGYNPQYLLEIAVMSLKVKRQAVLQLLLQTLILKCFVIFFLACNNRTKTNENVRRLPKF